MEVHHIQLLVTSVCYRNVWRLDTDSQNLRDYLKKCKRSSLNCIGGIPNIKEDPAFVKYLFFDNVHRNRIMNGFKAPMSRSPMKVKTPPIYYHLL